MDAETQSLFERVSLRLGLHQSSDLAELEKQLKQSIIKNKTHVQPTFLKPDLNDLDSPVFESCFQVLQLSDSDCHFSLRDKERESTQQKRQWAMAKPPNSTGLESFSMTRNAKEAEAYEKDQIHEEKESNVRKWTQKHKQRSTISISDSSDEEFETFLSQLKTPKAKADQIQTKQDNSLKGFIVDLEENCFISSVIKTENKIGTKKGVRDFQETSITTTKNNRFAQDWTTSVFTRKSDDEDFIIKGTFYESCKEKRQQEKGDLRPGSTDSVKVGKQKETFDYRLNSYSLLDWEKDFKQPSVCVSTHPELQNHAHKVSKSSDDEFEALMEQVKSTRSRTPRSTAKKTRQLRIASKDIESSSPWETKKTSMPKPKCFPKMDSAPLQLLPNWSPKIRSASCSEQTFSSDQWRAPCQVPGCFLQELSNSASAFVKNFKQKKEELTQRLYMLYNSSIFNQELPGNMEIIWNKNMRKTAGYCVTGQRQELGMLRYAKIELSEKVCDSADRLRDTLIHEMCHAATWLINGVRDGHGQFWKLYAKKSAVVHPELPVVARCHNYAINYKFSYKCSCCGTVIGRHSKSLDTQHFVCAVCQGKLVLLQPAYKDGTLTKTQLTLFAKSGKENYESSRKEASGQNCNKLMKKLSAEFAAKMYTSDL